MLGVEDSEARLVLFAGAKAQNRHNKWISMYLPPPLFRRTIKRMFFCYQKYATRAVEDWAQRPFAYALQSRYPGDCVMLSLFRHDPPGLSSAPEISIAPRNPHALDTNGNYFPLSFLIYPYNL